VILLRNDRRTTRKRIPASSPQPVGKAGGRRHPRTNSRSTRVLKRDLGIVAVVGSLLLMVYVFQYACVARAGYERAHLRSELRLLDQENSNLRAGVEVLERPQRIDHLARQRGMVQRSDADYVALAPLPANPPGKNRPMIAGFLPEWLNKLVQSKR
jgi:cell division protein FtsL